MSWSLFAVIQLGLVTLGMTGALWLRDRGIKARFRALDETLANRLLPAANQSHRDLEAEMDLSQEAEHLRAANELLRHQLAEARTALITYRLSSQPDAELAESSGSAKAAPRALSVRSSA